MIRHGDWGHITHPKTGERFPVRFVRWDRLRQKLANLTANNDFIRGDFTEEAIEQLRGLEHEAHFAELQLDKLLSEIEAQQEDAEPTAGNCNPDDVPDVPAEPISKLGDLWLLGEHRLLCGSSTNPANVARLMNGERAVMMATDPPYLVDYDGTNHPQSFERQQAGKSNNKGWDAYVEKLYAKAIAGDTQAAKALVEHHAGKPQQAVDLSNEDGTLRPKVLEVRWVPPKSNDQPALPPPSSDGTGTNGT